MERQGTPARPAPGSSLSYPGYCDKTEADKGNCDVSDKGSLPLKPHEGLQVRSSPHPRPPLPLHPPLFTSVFLPWPEGLQTSPTLPQSPQYNPFVRLAQACLDKCRVCARCNYITFSEKYSDCSWTTAATWRSCNRSLVTVVRAPSRPSSCIAMHAPTALQWSVRNFALETQSL